jgi:hypothetical protein
MKWFIPARIFYALDVPFFKINPSEAVTVNAKNVTISINGKYLLKIKMNEFAS